MYTYIDRNKNTKNTNKYKSSESVKARRPEWNCAEETPRLFQCLWEPEEKEEEEEEEEEEEANKRITRGF